MDINRGFGIRLAQWRKQRGLSQMELAHRADVSQRHVSFLEVGRTQPSRDMVLRLAATLDLPMRQQNALLHAAGYAPVWREGSLDAPDWTMVNNALDFMLTQQEPFPALVVNRHWQLLRANAGAQAMIAFLTDSPGWTPDPQAPINLADALMSPTVLRPLLANWADVARYFLRGVQADAVADNTEETVALLRRLQAYPGVSGIVTPAALDTPPTPVLPMDFLKNGVSLRLFTTIATLGTPQDITAQEIRVENFYPADAQTSTIFAQWSASRTVNDKPRQGTP